jgi:hypothetical protein
MSSVAGEEYELKQARYRAEHASACLDWLASSSPEEIQQMMDMGIVRKVRHKNGTEELIAYLSDDEPAADLGRAEDLAEMLERWDCEGVSVRQDMAGHIDKLDNWLCEKFGVTPVQAKEIAVWHALAVHRKVRVETALTLRRVIGFFLLPEGSLLVRAHALAHAARMASINGLTSLRHSAELCRVSVEAIRKVAWQWIALLNLPPLEAAKSEEAKERYAEDKKTNHWRTQKCKTGMNLDPAKKKAKPCRPPSI